MNVKPLCESCIQKHLFKHKEPSREAFCFGVSKAALSSVPWFDRYRFCLVDGCIATSLQLSRCDVERLIEGFLELLK